MSILVDDTEISCFSSIKVAVSNIGTRVWDNRYFTVRFKLIPLMWEQSKSREQREKKREQNKRIFCNSKYWDYFLFCEDKRDGNVCKYNRGIVDNKNLKIWRCSLRRMELKKTQFPKQWAYYEDEIIEKRLSNNRVRIGSSGLDSF